MYLGKNKDLLLMDKLFLKPFLREVSSVGINFKRLPVFLQLHKDHYFD